jgi:hypothetical protein
MAIVRANIHTYGGPWALLSAYKRRGIAAVDLSSSLQSVISRRSRPLASLGEGEASGAAQTERPYYGGELGPNEHLTSAEALDHLKRLLEVKQSRVRQEVMPTKPSKRLRSNIVPGNQE